MTNLPRDAYPILPTRTPTSGTGTPTPTPTGPTPTPVTGPKGTATLTKAPTGPAHMTYDPNTVTFTAQITLTGLAPNSPHAVNFRASNCVSTGPVMVALPNVTANAEGNVNTSVSQMAQPATQPSSGWYLEVTTASGPVCMTRSIWSAPTSRRSRATLGSHDRAPSSLPRASGRA